MTEPLGDVLLNSRPSGHFVARSVSTTKSKMQVPVRRLSNTPSRPATADAKTEKYAGFLGGTDLKKKLCGDPLGYTHCKDSISFLILYYNKRNVGISRLFSRV